MKMFKGDRDEGFCREEAFLLHEHARESFGEFARGRVGSGVAPATDHLKGGPNFGGICAGGKQVEEQCEEAWMPHGNQTEITARGQGADCLFLKIGNTFAADVWSDYRVSHEPRFGAAEVAQVVVEADRNF